MTPSGDWKVAIMEAKPTYEALEQRVRALEEELARCGAAEGRTAQEELKAIFEMSLDMICIADLKTATFAKINPAFSAVLGYSEPELLQRPFLDLIHPEDVGATRRIIEECLQKGEKVINFKNRFRCKWGGYRWLNWVSRPQPDKGITVAVAHDITDEVNAAMALQESERRFRLMADFTYSWEYWIAADKRLVYVSPSCRDYTGFSAEEFMRDNGLILTIVHPQDREDFARHLEREAHTPRVTSLEFRVVDRGGKERWIQHTCQPIYDERGNPLGRLASNREITDQKLAQIKNAELTENLKKTTNLLNAVLDAIPDVIGVQDHEHRIIQYNQAGYRLAGRPPSEAHGMKCYELIGRDRPCEVCATTEVYRTKQIARVEKFVPEVGRWLDVRAYPILDENGELSRVIEHLRDITREKAAESELKEAHERLTTILDSIEAHIYVADIESHRILFINRKMKEDFQRDLVGSICYEAFRGETKPCDHCTNPRLLDASGAPCGVIVWEASNPITGRWYLNCDRAIRWVDGHMVRLQIATDITQTKKFEQERTRMEMQLQQAQKFEAIGTLAGGIAHDFNNLLMGIQGRASLMMIELAPPHPHLEHLHAIEEYIRSATDLTKQLLGFARGGKYQVTPFDINELLLTSASMFGRTKKEIRVHTQCQGAPLVVEADRGQIEQVLLNMFVNSWQAMPEGGELCLETKAVELDEAFCRPHQIPAGRYVRVTVADTGIGMSAATRQRVFDPFFTTKEKGRGTGLGLASAYGITKNHGGLITVESEEGHGATFTVYLPASDKEIGPEISLQGTLLKGWETILLVDDEDMILDVGRCMLEKLGYRVLPARGGQEAVEALGRANHDIQLVILDLIMPEMDGGKTFDRLRAIRPDLRVLLSSGYALDRQAEEIMRRGCNGFIQKPFTISELSNKVRAILDRSEPR